MPSNNINNEQELLQRIAEGDERAFAELFNKWQARLFHYVKTIIKSSEVAEEVVMDVMTKLWLGRELLPQVDNMTAFLFRIAYRRSIDILRSAARNVQLADMIWETIEAMETSRADDALLTKQYEDALREAIGLLSGQRHKVYQMSREQHKTHGEIAATLNISKNTVSNHITEATRFIRDHLSKRMGIVIAIGWFTHH